MKYNMFTYQRSRTKTKSILDEVAIACDDMHASFGDELPRVAQMVRDPFDMVVSGYLYHSQKPTPERFVHSYVPSLRIQRYDV